MSIGQAIQTVAGGICGLAVVGAIMAWVMVLPTIGLLWLLGWLA